MPPLSTTFQRRRTVLVLLIAGTVPTYAATSSLVGRARATRQQIAVGWARQGQQDLRAGRPGPAAEDFRTAQQYARDRSEYRLQLALALVAADRRVEAKSQLLTLWAETPGDGVVNRELGRIAARDADVGEALRYYHAAIDGAWPAGAAEERRRARTELARFLIARGDLTHAQSELISLADDLPDDPAVMTETAALLLQAGADARALTLLQRALERSPHDPRALRLAGEAAYAAADYRTARGYLDAAADRLALDVRGRQMLDISERVMTLDPYARRISSRERVRRVVRAFDVAREALARCPPEALADLRSEVDAFAPTVVERSLARDPDAVDDTLAIVTRVEAAIDACGPPGDDARALQLVFRQRRPAS
jgi:tetratricopeptide (TPR) repeat protein